jgi:hypothetical protein
MSALGSALVLYDSEHVALTHHQIFLVAILQLCSGILAIEHDIALLQNHRIVLCALANGNDLAALWFLLGCVRDDDSTYFLLSWCRKYQHSVC